MTLLTAAAEYGDAAAAVGLVAFFVACGLVLVIARETRRAWDRAWSVVCRARRDVEDARDAVRMGRLR